MIEMELYTDIYTKKKSLKIPKGSEEFVNRRRTYNTMYKTMAKRKRAKGQTTIYKTMHRKLKI